MSKTSLEAFHTHLKHHPLQLQQLLEGAPDTEKLIQRAIACACEQGLAFTPQEAREWLQQNGPLADQELSDNQLESVAGGKALSSTGSDADPSKRSRMRP